ncbi:MAG: hypothetical protein QM523_02740 [Candidatus Pacebacteria bacterium]|nr:hypothetical protein [Candidatus Paceibacterota bacterium]
MKQKLFIMPRSRLDFFTLTLSILIGLVLLTGCSGSGKKTSAGPAMIPLVETGPYGYAEQPIDMTHVRIQFRGPRYRTKLSHDHPDRKGLERIANIEAYNFAVWRAAQLSVKNRYPGFRIINQSPSIVIAPITSMPNPPINDDRIGVMDSTQRDPGLGTPQAISQGDSFQVTYTIVIEYQDEILPGDFEAQKIIVKMSKNYPGASE